MVSWLPDHAETVWADAEVLGYLSGDLAFVTPLIIPEDSKIVLCVHPSLLPSPPLSWVMEVEYPSCPIGFGLGQVTGFGQWKVDMTGC